ncbi:aminotransferase class I/II-fold pyridoxal phosphate-dependent enzyme [Lactiplantibacillus paraplantarum]|uniref:aminotransferase class I/II-fold pyridoxal phosphate-dependent enzyme n=1 Tax=Lactiplantibacillus paraplantarum TaxID=60520 RepID=UPI000513F53C|nr:aminotransferase class I/II-fold pyridoxal phosphate-dependent enzyme [Lactiplantibacillus paraplantarum]ALO03400.1 hypothetical protein ASU28_02975 [Lactiplantibacillus paraplantarum]KGE76620.1 hypothetical protein HR47_00315 [Lactiplantibacillus paraplantarum]RDG08487.1 aminotransferase class I/II-fold pyridoxal phosphate-dependent enzyme [Lactiplantibacillus paraplantarum]
MSRFPLTEKILSYADKDIKSFHALPITKNKFSKQSEVNQLFEKLIGTQYTKNEVTYGNGWIDNPTFPSTVLLDSQKQTAGAFNCDASLYVTTGTSNANQISIFGNIKRNDRVLVDRCCHQSVHFALSLIGAKVDYTKIRQQFDSSGRQLTDFDQLLSAFLEAYEEGRPFKTVVLNASTYEGVCNNTSLIIEKLLAIDPSVTLIVDEAWIAFAAFSKETKHLSLLSNIDSIRRKYPDLKLVVTQSAHKSLRSLRQGSYIHIIGSKSFIENIVRSKYEFSTTSPSYPLLASLELAREDIVQNGAKEISKAIQRAQKLATFINNLNSLYVNKELEIIDSEFYSLDPLRVSVNFSNSVFTIEDLKKIFYENNLYISRYTESSFLLNFHIGTDDVGLEKLCHVLQKIDDAPCEFNDGDVSDEYIIPYPPGVPLIVPGEKFNSSIIAQLSVYEHSKTKLIKVKRVL